MSTQEHEAAARLTCEKIHPWMKDVHLLEPGRYCPSCDGIAAALADAVRVARAEQEERTLHGALAMIDRVVREHRNSSHMMDVPIRQAINQWWHASRKVLGTRAGEGDATPGPEPERDFENLKWGKSEHQAFPATPPKKGGAERVECPDCGLNVDLYACTPDRCGWRASKDNR